METIKNRFIKIQLFANKKPTTEQIVEIVVGTGATALQGAESATLIANILSTSADGNDYLTEFNNAIEQRYNDTSENATIYDIFKKKANAPTLQAVVYEKIAPNDFSFATDIAVLDADEQENTRKLPKVHSILKSLNIQSRFKTTSSALELSKIANGQSVSADNIVANLGASYADDRTDKFITLVDGIESNKTKDEVNAMADIANVSSFIQKLKYYTFKFKEKRTDKYNAFVLEGDITAKSDTKMRVGDRPVCFINPEKLYKIEGDYYATLYKLQEALPDIDFVEVDGLTDADVFAKLCDPRVVEWSEFDHEIRSEQIRGRESGEFNHYLFAKDIFGSYNCFDRVVFRTKEKE